MRNINFRLAVVCAVILAIACSVGASSVSALSAEGSDLIDKLTSVAGDLGVGGIIDNYVTTKEATTTRGTSQGAEEELGNIIGQLGLGADILKITDLVSYLNRGGSLADWVYDNYGESVKVPDSVNNMSSADIVMYLMSMVLYPDRTTAEPTTPGYVFIPGNNKETTTKKQEIITAEPTTLASYRTGDVDGDGKVTAKDARLALRASAQIEKLYATPFDAADVNGDGRVTASDARRILRYAAKITNGF